jgi:hypothetical protein
MKREPDSWGLLPEPSNEIVIEALPPFEAEELFLKRFKEISGQM